MSRGTKRRIAEALRELMATTAMHKITVKQLVDRAEISRQGFYYHFQDVYSVLEWDVQYHFRVLMKYDPDKSCVQWIMDVLSEIQRDHAFYRKAVRAIGHDTVILHCIPVSHPYVCSHIFGSPKPPDDFSEDELYALQLIEKMLCSHLLKLATQRTDIDIEQSYKRLAAMLSMCRKPVDDAPASAARSAGPRSESK